MEYVAGQEMEDVVRRNGPMSVSRACSIAHQIASALSETHKYGLVHRDIKPSNIMLTGEDQAKLLDFGLSRHFGHRMTVPGTILGTVDYMAPEQARDATTVDIRADIFGLGGVLYWCLTGQLPFPCTGNPVEALTQRLHAPTPSIRDINRDFSPGLDDVVGKMMAHRPEDRFADPAAVMQALLPFVRPDTGEHEALTGLPPAATNAVVTLPDSKVAPDKFRVLVVDDESPIRGLCKQLLEVEGAQVDSADSGTQGLEMAVGGDYDLVLLDVTMPDINGVEVLTQLRQQQAKGTNQKVLMFSGHSNLEEMSELLARGADDFLTKPFSVAQLLARVQNLLRLKAAQDHAAAMNRHLLEINAELEQNLQEQEREHVADAEAEAIRSALVLTIARLIEQREGRGAGHPSRMQKYGRVLAEGAASHQAFAGQINCSFVELLEACAPVHDMGRMAIPDHVLMKIGSLTPEERLTMEAHTIIAADAFRESLPKLGEKGRAFLQMAVDVAKSHHERHDGTGYPDRLAGDAIPLAARLVAVADVYDALRCRRLYKPALPHSAAVQIVMQNSPGQFDPAILEVFQQVAPRFDAIFRETPD
jgi:response regulator RpfG family c-di-GMP phosphodiesterase